MNEKKVPQEVRSVDGHQPNWSPPLSLWPPSRPLPIKPNPLPPSLSPIIPSRATLPPPLYLFLILPFVLLSYPHSQHYPYTYPDTMPDASKPIQKGSAPSHLVALPSLSNSLSSLPQAKSLAHVAVYNSSMSGQHAAESEAKVCVCSLSLLPSLGLELYPNGTPFSSQLKKALSNNVGAAQTLAYAASVSRSRRPSDCARAFQTENSMQPTTVNPTQTSHAIMMRKPVSLLSSDIMTLGSSSTLGSNKTTGLMVTTAHGTTL